MADLSHFKPIHPDPAVVKTVFNNVLDLMARNVPESIRLLKIENGEYDDDMVAKLWRHFRMNDEMAQSHYPNVDTLIQELGSQTAHQDVHDAHTLLYERFLTSFRAVIIDNSTSSCLSLWPNRRDKSSLHIVRVDDQFLMTAIPMSSCSHILNAFNHEYAKRSISGDLLRIEYRRE